MRKRPVSRRPAAGEPAVPAPAASPEAVPLGPLARALRHFEQVLELRLRQRFDPETQAAAVGELPAFPAPAAKAGDPYSCFVRDHRLDDGAQLLLLLALTPWVDPELIDRVAQRVLPAAGDYPQLGGVRGRQHRGFLPTGDTALFLLAGADLAARAHWQAMLWGDHPLVAKGIVELDDAPDGEPAMSGRLVLDRELAERFLTGRVRAPRMSFHFPARRLESGRDWDDLVLPHAHPRPDRGAGVLAAPRRDADGRAGAWRTKLRPGLPRAVLRPARAPARP